MSAEVRAVNGATQQNIDLHARQTKLFVSNPSLLCIAVLIVITIVWSRFANLTVVGWQQSLFAFLFLIFISVFYKFIRPVPALSSLSFYAACWAVLSMTGGISTYFASSARQPLQDAAFGSFDAMLGFDWVAWAQFVRSNLVLNAVLRAAYVSFMPQIIGSLIFFALARVPGRNQELFVTAAFGLLITTLVSAILPALGPWVQYDYSPLMPQDLAYVPHVIALRQGDPQVFVLGEMQGIVCFPSYHTVIALLLIYVHRGIRWIFPLVLVLNGLMLLSIPSEGGHYLADMVASIPVALLAIGIMRSIQPRQPRATKAVSDQGA